MISGIQLSEVGLLGLTQLGHKLVTGRFIPGIVTYASISFIHCAILFLIIIIIACLNLFNYIYSSNAWKVFFPEGFLWYTLINDNNTLYHNSDSQFHAMISYLALSQSHTHNNNNYISKLFSDGVWELLLDSFTAITKPLWSKFAR